MKKLTPEDPQTHSADVVSENVERLRELFPEVFTEGRIDFDVLKQLLSGVLDERDEKYGLNWHGKRRARQLALSPSTGTLRPCPEESVDWDTTQNLMIEGDNLEVLKLLQKSYAGKVKLIYIDPPYNTGKDFVYPDDFRDSIRNYLEVTGQVDGENGRVSSNTEASGRFHTDWLNMVFPRLMLARDLLRRDGLLMVSIDDNEVSNLRRMCDEVFGEENFVATIIWEKGRKNDAKLFSSGHDYILVFARSKARLNELGLRWREAKPGAQEIQTEYLRIKAESGGDLAKITEGLRAFYASLPRSHPSKKLSRYRNVDALGVWRDDNMSWPGGGGPTYEVRHPVTGEPCAVPEGGWRFSTPEKMQTMIDAGRVQFREDHTEPPIRKTYLVSSDADNEDEEAEDNAGIQVAGTYFYRSALQASRLMLDLFGSKVFDNPKDHTVLARWFRYMGDSDRDDIVLDFFAGSGSTAHAVMDLNAGDSGSRRYILVQLPEPLDRENKEQAAAAKYCHEAGKQPVITELTKERLRRAGHQVREANPMFPGDVGFRVFKLDHSNIRAWDPSPEDLDAALFDGVEHLREGRTEQDVLYELLLKLGLDLCVPIEERTIAGKTVHSIGAGTLFVCLPKKVAPGEVEELALGIAGWREELNPAGETTVVFRDSAFADDVAKTNASAILEQHGIENVRSL